MAIASKTNKKIQRLFSFAFSAAMIDLLNCARVSCLPLQNEIRNDADNSTDNQVILYGRRSGLR